MEYIWYDWYDKKYTRTPEEYPYSYDAFFIYGNHKTIKGENVNPIYSDRYNLWDRKKYQEALEISGLLGFGLNPPNPILVNKFVKAYHGPNYDLVGIVNSCNVSSGYPVWVLFVRNS